MCAKGVVDVGLQGRELLVGNGLGVLVAGNVDVDNTTGVDVRREEDGREFDLSKRSRLACRRRGNEICRCSLRIMIPSGMDSSTEAVGEWMLGTHKAFVFSEEHGDSSVDLADSQ